MNPTQILEEMLAYLDGLGLPPDLSEGLARLVIAVLEVGRDAYRLTLYTRLGLGPEFFTALRTIQDGLFNYTPQQGARP